MRRKRLSVSVSVSLSVRVKYIALILVGFALTISACTETEPQFRDISEFNIVEANAGLQNGEQIEVLVSSYGGITSLKYEAYLQMVVRSLETGKHYNILTYSNFDLGVDDNVRDFISNMHGADYDHIDSRVVDKAMKKELTKVIYDPAILELDNEFPTVFGSVGKVTRTSE